MHRTQEPLPRMLRVLAASLACACATVPSGAGGVLWTPGGVSNEPVPEGQHFIGPLAKLQLYDLRRQEKNEDLVGITADGALVEAGASVVTFHLRAEDLVAVDRELGPDYYANVISPVVRAAARRVLSRYRLSELDTPGVRRAQGELGRLLAERLSSLHVVIDDVVFRHVLPRSQALDAAVLDTGRLEQEALAASTSLLELAARDGDARRELAVGIAARNKSIAPTLTPRVLLDARREASQRLIESPSTQVLFPSALPLSLEVLP